MLYARGTQLRPLSISVCSYNFSALALFAGAFHKWYLHILHRILALSCSHVPVDNPLSLVDQVSLNSCLKIFSAEITQEIQRIQHSCFKWPSLQLKWPRSNTSSRDNSRPSAPTVRNIASLAARVLLFHSDVVFEEKSELALRHIQETYVHRRQYDLVAPNHVHSLDL